MPAGRPKGTLAPTTPVLTPAQLDKMVELHDRYKLSYRAIGTRYGIGEKRVMRLIKKQKEGTVNG
jgi:hypothetical protein